MYKEGEGDGGGRSKNRSLGHTHFFHLTNYFVIVSFELFFSHLNCFFFIWTISFALFFLSFELFLRSFELFLYFIWTVYMFIWAIFLLIWTIFTFIWNISVYMLINCMVPNFGSVLVNDFWTHPPLLSILYTTIYFSANLLLFIFLFRVRLGYDTFWAERCG